jgi:cytochrome c-type biogenesis protein CcmH/NrfF
VLLTPPSSGLGSLIWIVPIVGFAAAVVALVALFSRWRREVGARATDADRDLVAEELARRGTAGGSDELDVGGEGRSDG